MSNITCLSPLKIYDSLSKQNHRKSYAYGNVSPLVMKLGVIDAFQFCLYKDDRYFDDYVTDIYLVDAKTDRTVLDITSYMEENGFTVQNINGIYVATYPGVKPIPSITQEGEYYLRLDGNLGVEYVSEVFSFSNNLDGYLELKYSNDETFSIKDGIVDLQGIEFIIRVKTEVGKPEYKFEEEATKRLGYAFIESQVSSKIYKFNAIMPEYLCDALRLVKLCNKRKVISGEDEFEPITFDMSVEWQEQGDLASVTCEFQTDNVIVRLGNPKYELSRGDFNNDFDPLDFSR